MNSQKANHLTQQPQSSSETSLQQPRHPSETYPSNNKHTQPSHQSSSGDEPQSNPKDIENEDDARQKLETASRNHVAAIQLNYKATADLQHNKTLALCSATKAQDNSMTDLKHDIAHMCDEAKRATTRNLFLESVLQEENRLVTSVQNDHHVRQNEPTRVPPEIQSLGEKRSRRMALGDILQDLDLSPDSLRDVVDDCMQGESFNDTRQGRD